MEAVRCEGVTKRYGSGPGQVTALEHVDLSIGSGTFTAITGASGSGKSTLLHLLGTVDRPTEGRIVIDGVDISSFSATECSLFRRRKVGLIYQFYNLIPSLTVSRNIKLPVLLDKKKVDEEYFAYLTKLLGLEDKLDSFPGQLSGGQQQRAAIARALLYRPSVLLADEPTGNLDQKNSEEIVKLLKRSNRELHQTIILVTHDERIALSADRIIKMEDGRIRADEPVLRCR